MNAQAQEKTAQMHWEKLITSKRFGMEQYHDDRHHTRTDFQRDYDRLVFSAPVSSITEQNTGISSTG